MIDRATRNFDGKTWSYGKKVDRTKKKITIHFWNRPEQKICNIFCCGTAWDVEFRVFMYFFKKKTSMQWRISNKNDTHSQHFALSFLLVVFMCMYLGVRVCAQCE